jgi:hypothetical protein
LLKPKRLTLGVAVTNLAEKQKIKMAFPQLEELWKLIDLLVRKDFRQANLDIVENREVKVKNATGSIAGIQIDLKYHMYNKRYLNSLLDWLPEQGINTVLLEYEDKFPYRKYPFLKAEDAITPSELRAFLNKARSRRLKVIPLVQSLSHLEFAMRHPALSHLAEAMDAPTQICPSNPESVEFILDLYREVLEYPVLGSEGRHLRHAGSNQQLMGGFPYSAAMSASLFFGDRRVNEFTRTEDR